MAKTTTHIALVCPGGQITQDLAEKTGEIAASHFGDAVQLHFHSQCFLSAGHFAGTDTERRAAFLEVANDPQYDAVWFARGGYGAGRLAEDIFAKLGDAAHNKIYLGYSDTGFLLAGLYKHRIGKPVHGPMPTDLARNGGEEAIIRALDYLVTQNAETLEPTAQSGRKTIAFNITVLAHLVSAPWMPDLAGHVLMLEDVGEYLYCIDRAMFAIVRGPGIKNAEGIMLGRVCETPENDRPFGQTEEEIIQYWCAKAGVAYLGRADIGHDPANKIVPFGGVKTP